jgi:cobalt-zinc-cadmium efflux system outer membrane protein
MQRRAAAICTAAALALGACATGGQNERYHEMRERLSRIQTAPQADEDPLANTPTLSRSALVAAVLERNPSVEAARASWQAALARYPQETALADPMFGYSVRPRSFGSSQVDPANDFALSQALPFPGKLALRGERALAEADAAANAVDVERVQLAALASRLFDEYWLAERALETNTQHLTLLDEAHSVALSRYSAGRGSQQDVLAAETEQAMLSHREIELGAERRVLAERINTLLHRPPQLELPTSPRELTAEPARDLDERGLVAQALEQRPELRARQADVRAREADVSLARREFFPDFTLRAAYEGSWQEDPLKPVVGIEVNVPLQLGRRRAALEEADARLSREKSRLRQLEDRVRLEVTSAIERLRESQHLLHISRERLVPAARDRVAGARAAFASGESTFLELVDAERSLRTAEQAEFEARASLAVRGAELSRALGETPETGEGQL